MNIPPNGRADQILVRDPETEQWVWRDINRRSDRYFVAFVVFVVGALLLAGIVVGMTTGHW